jgi:hypothetical protein
MSEGAGSFDKYFNRLFMRDLERFLSTIPEESKHHPHFFDGKEVTIQHDQLVWAAGHTAFLKGKEREYFGVALFFVVLIDQVTQRCFATEYDVYIKRITRQPKWIGTCPVACRAQQDPSDIFNALAEGWGKVLFQEVFHEAEPIIQEYFRLFFGRLGLSEIWDSVWAACLNESPFRKRSEGAQLWDTQIRLAGLDLAKDYIFSLGDGSTFHGKPREFLDKIDEGHWSYDSVANCRLPTAIPEGEEPDPAKVREHYVYLREKARNKSRTVELGFDDGSGFIGPVEMAAKYLARRFTAMPSTYEIIEISPQSDECFELPVPTSDGKRLYRCGRDPRF